MASILYKTGQTVGTDIRLSCTSKLEMYLLLQVGAIGELSHECFLHCQLQFTIVVGNGAQIFDRWRYSWASLHKMRCTCGYGFLPCVPIISWQRSDSLGEVNSLGQMTQTHVDIGFPCVSLIAGRDETDTLDSFPVCRLCQCTEATDYLQTLKWTLGSFPPVCSRPPHSFPLLHSYSSSSCARRLSLMWVAVYITLCVKIKLSIKQTVHSLTKFCSDRGFKIHKKLLGN